MQLTHNLECNFFTPKGESVYPRDEATYLQIILYVCMLGKRCKHIYRPHKKAHYS